MNESNEKQEPKQRYRQLYVRLPIFIGVSFTLGILLGATMFGSNSGMKEIFLNYNKYREVLTHIDQKYVDTVNIDELVDFSISKMLEKLDPHTTYIPTEEVSLANTHLEGNYEGIGIEFNIYKDTIYVVAPIPNGPSETAGLRAGDKIISINDEDVATIKIDNAGVFKRLRGEKGSKVQLGIVRQHSNEVLTYTVTRDEIPSISVYSYMLNEKTGFIKITRFARNTYEEFIVALKDMKQRGAKQLMIDLRDNPGGYMDDAVKIADELIAGDAMIVYTDGKGNLFDSEERADKRGLFEKGPIVVLINEGSASASEILSGALQDNDRALIVGRRSYGKGLVQMPIQRSDGSELMLTISRYYTPSGRSIQKGYKSNEDYATDLLKRFEHGEMFHADSIQFNDSLAYKTEKGRTVYGGGGIMPDYFVPLDTNANTTYANKLHEKNIPREFAIDYYNTHKKSLDAMELSEFISTFKVDEAMIAQIIQLGEANDIAYDKEAFKRSEQMLKGHVKAYMAKTIWGNEGFYKIWYQDDKVYRQASRMFEEAEQLLK